jgi:hypothetical protein
VVKKKKKKLRASIFILSYPSNAFYSQCGVGVKKKMSPVSAPADGLLGKDLKSLRRFKWDNMNSKAAGRISIPKPGSTRKRF